MNLAWRTVKAAGDHFFPTCGGHRRVLDYMHARYCSPAQGRFLSVDPVLDIEKTLRTPQLWNRYSYVGNNPLGYVDLREKVRIRPTARAYVGSNRPYVYSITFEIESAWSAGGWRRSEAIARAPLRQLPGIIDNGADFIVGKEAKTDAKNLKGVDATGREPRCGTAGKGGVQSVALKSGDRLMYDQATKEFAYVNKPVVLVPPGGH